MFIEFEGFKKGNSFSINSDDVTGVWTSTDKTIADESKRDFTTIETHNETKNRYRTCDSVTQVTKKLNGRQQVVKLEGKSRDSVAVDPICISHVFWSTEHDCAVIRLKTDRWIHVKGTAKEVINKLWPELTTPEIEQKVDEGRKLEV